MELKMKLERRKIPVVLSFVIAAAIYFILILKYTVNIPSWDDFDAILAYGNHPFLERIPDFWSQHNEHRLVFVRLCTELSMAIFRKIDFRFLIILGNLGVLGLSILFLTLWVKQKLPLSNFIGLLLLIFAPVSWINMIWALAAIQNLWVLFFSFLTLITFDVKTRKGVLLSSLFGLMALFSSGSGLIVIGICFLRTLWDSIKKAKQDQKLSVIQHSFPLFYYSAFTIIVLMIYFYHYQSPEGHPHFGQTIQHPWLMARYFIVFLGSFAGNLTSAKIVGLIFIGWIIYISMRRYYAVNPVLYGWILFFVLNAAVAMVTRSGFGIKQALDVRYQIVSLMLAGCCYFSMVELFGLKGKIFQIAQAGILSLIVLFYGYSIYHANDKMKRHHSILINKMIRYQTTGSGLHYPVEKESRAIGILRKAISKGRYQMPALKTEE